jgi:hypothetical protein
VTLDTPLFADGPAAAHSIALLPLAEGYTTSYYNLDVGSQRVLPVRLRVVGSESVTVPAGTFDTFKVEYAAEGGNQSTLWVAKELRELGVITYPSGGNFLLADFGPTGPALFRKLERNGILLRDRSKDMGSGFVRVTMGSFAEMRLLLKIIRKEWNPAAGTGAIQTD